MNADESSNVDELLWRQVHPTFLHDGRPTSQTFRPSPKDEDQLSVDRASLTSAAESYGRHVRAGFRSEGVLAVTVGQCQAESLSVRADPLLTGDHPNSAHALIDFRTLPSRGRRETAAKALTAHALTRGWQHRRP